MEHKHEANTPISAHVMIRRSYCKIMLLIPTTLNKLVSTPVVNVTEFMIPVLPFSTTK